LLFYILEKILSDGNFLFKTELIKIYIDIKSAETLLKEAIQIIKSSIPKSSENCIFCKFRKIS